MYYFQCSFIKLYVRTHILLKHKISNYIFFFSLTTILELSSKITPLSSQMATIKAALSSLVSSLASGYSMEIEAGEEERAEGGSIFEELDHLTVI